MKKNICVVTTSRAEFGLLKPLIKQINQHRECNLQLIVSGTHLAQQFGNTVDEINAENNFEILKKIAIIDENNINNTANIMANVLNKFNDCFVEIKPDLIILLGDRYEIISVATVATLLNIPVCHLHGGETTEGAIDEVFRHCISKMSYLHFTATEDYRKRVIQLGEDHKRVFNVGAIANESLQNIKFLSQNKLAKSLNFTVDKQTLLVTFHPVTLDGDISVVEQQFNELLTALELAINNHNLKIIFTKANADNGGEIINNLIDSFVEKNQQHCRAFFSLGQQRYYSAIKYCGGVVGNSSSGIIEVPFFNQGTINIGDRQRGRIQAVSTVNCRPEKQQIIDAIEKLYSDEFQCVLTEVVSPYSNSTNLGDLSISQFILTEIIKSLDNGIDLKKKFHDLV